MAMETKENIKMKDIGIKLTVAPEGSLPKGVIGVVLSRSPHDPKFDPSKDCVVLRDEQPETTVPSHQLEQYRRTIESVHLLSSGMILRPPNWQPRDNGRVPHVELELPNAAELQAAHERSMKLLSQKQDQYQIKRLREDGRIVNAGRTKESTFLDSTTGFAADAKAIKRLTSNQSGKSSSTRGVATIAWGGGEIKGVVVEVTEAMPDETDLEDEGNVVARVVYNHSESSVAKSDRPLYTRDELRGRQS